MKDISLLVMSCDSYSDIWKPFFQLKNKYWKDCPYTTYIGTETKQCEYATTLKTQGSWTKRVRECLEQIDTEYVLFMLDDFFIRSKVDQDRIDKIEFNENTAVYNFEIVNNNGTGFEKKKNKSPYMNSCQPSIHNRLKLIERLQGDRTAWEWELTQIDSKYDFYINNSTPIIDIGQKYLELFGIARGKWTLENYRFFKKEGIDIDFNKRGFFKGSLGVYENNPKLSIIIPYYKTYELTKILLDNLCNQITDEVEVILIDDGCNDISFDKYPIKVIHSKINGGLSYARNRGIEILTGRFITFIDSDDNISKDYIEKILNKIDTSTFDYCIFSFRYVGDIQKDVIIKGEPEAWNNCVWNCIYKKEIVGRFDESIQMIEDKVFNETYRKGKRENIEDILYNYLWGRKDSLSQQNARKEIGIERYKYKLSIIIPYYKTLELTKKLLDILIPQLTEECELIIIDDGCNEKELDKYNVIHQENGGVSKARNTGIDNAKGEFIAFIDSDDMVSDNYIKTILEKIKEKWDYCYISWKDSKNKTYIIEDNPPPQNNCVWNCIYRKTLIGDNRFDENIQYGEEVLFNANVKRYIKANITDVLYTYNVDRENSLNDLMAKGIITEKRPLKAQIVMFLRFVSKIGGIETFLYEFFKAFHKTHDILFLYEESDPHQLLRYKKMVRCQLYTNEKVECETYINVNCTKNIADNVSAKIYYDMAHTDYTTMGWKYTTHPKTNITLAVSETVKQAILKQYPKLKIEVLPNLLNLDKPNRVLYLVSALRLSWEKGYNRMKIMAKRLNERNLPFIWLVFTNDFPDEEIDGFTFRKPTYSVCDYIAKSDYYITLSNTEACSYSNQEAFALGIPIISTNYPSIYEQGMQIGKTGYVLEMDLSNLDEVIDKMYDNKLEFKPIKNDYAKLWDLGKETKSSYIFNENEQVKTQLDISDKWIALMRMKDDNKNIILEGGTPILKSTERIRILLENGIIKRKEN